MIFERVRNFAEISEDIRKHLTRDYTDQDVDQLVKQTRKKLDARIGLREA